jgi:hypothetical protein
VNNVVKSIIHSLHITTTGKGIAFAFPLTHMKGISLTKEDIFKEKAYEVNIDGKSKKKSKKSKKDKKDKPEKIKEEVNEKVNEEDSEPSTITK